MISTKSSVLLLLLISFAIVDNSNLCAVTQLPPAEGAYGFNTCSQYQDLACCLEGHDNDIGNQFVGTLLNLGESCPYGSTSGSLLNQWICLGCDPNQPKFVVNETTILVCQDFAEALWGDGTKYDGCGLFITNAVVTPSTFFDNITTFMSQVPPPYLSNFNFTIIEESKIASTYGDPNLRCFGGTSNAGSILSYQLFTLFNLICILLVLIH